MATKVVTFDRTAVVTAIGEALLPLTTAIDQMGDMSAEVLTDLSFVMHAINKTYGVRRAKYDATLEQLVKDGKVSVSDTIAPVRAWRKPDAATPGRKAETKSEADKLREALGLA